MDTFRVRLRPKGAVSPVVASAAEIRPSLASGYDAASRGPRLSRWRAPQSGPNALLGAALPELRARSHDLVRQNGLADGIIWSVMVPNIIGTGIRPQFSTRDRSLDADLAALFDLWTDVSDADEGLDFYGQQALAVASMLEGGDCFGRMRRRLPSDGLPVPLQIQLLEAEYCPEERWETLPNGNEIRAGIEFDQIGRRVAYWMHGRHPLDWYATASAGDLTPSPILARNIVHLRAVRRAGMLRGEPWIVRTILKLHDLDGYDDAQLLRQKIAAMFAGFAYDAGHGEAEDADHPMVAGATATDGTTMAALDPGTIQELAPGQQITFSTPPRPGDDYADYKRDQHRLVAIAAGILYEQLTGDYSMVNDRTWRAAVNEFRRRCAMWQHDWVVQQFCRPILATWADMALLSGAIKLPRSIDPARLRRATWVPQAWPYINPVQDVEAREAEVRAGFKSRRRQMQEAGDDLDQMDAEQAADNKRADELGLAFDTDGRRPKGRATSAPEPAPAPAEPAKR